MPRQRTEVRKIRQSLQHHFENGYSDRYIAELCGISHPTVKKIRMLVLEAGYTWPLPACQGTPSFPQLGDTHIPAPEEVSPVFMGCIF